jgi:hypothetical protein
MFSRVSASMSMAAPGARRDYTSTREPTRMECRFVTPMTAYLKFIELQVYRGYHSVEPVLKAIRSSVCACLCGLREGLLQPDETVMRMM